MIERGTRDAFIRCAMTIPLTRNVRGPTDHQVEGLKPSTSGSGAVDAPPTIRGGAR